MGKKFISISVNLNGLQDKHRWYTVTTLYNYEEAFAKDLIESINATDVVLRNKIEDVYVPIKETVTQVTDKKGKVNSKVKKEKLYPNYVFVKVIMDEEVWFHLNHTKGCSTVLAHAGSPIPISEQEIDKIKFNCGYTENKELVEELFIGEKGDPVLIVSGPFEGRNGTVTDIHGDKITIKVDGSLMKIELNNKNIKKVI